VIEDVTNTIDQVQKNLDEPSTTKATSEPAELLTQEVASRTDTPRALSQEEA
jgi:hypothetical protein